jgi:hypothetical protein
VSEQQINQIRRLFSTPQTPDSSISRAAIGKARVVDSEHVQAAREEIAP